MMKAWVLGAAVAALWQVAGHYFPWAALTGRKELPRLVCYLYGVLGILWGLATWAAVTEQWAVVPVAGAMAAAAGLATGICWGLDALLRARAWKEVRGGGAIAGRDQ